MLQLTCQRSITTTPIVQLTSALYRDYVRQHSSDVKLYSELEQLARRKVLTSLSMCQQKPNGTSTRTCQIHFYSYYNGSGGRKLSRLLVNVHKHLVWNDREIINNPSFLENKNPGFILQTWDLHRQQTAITYLTLYEEHKIRPTSLKLHLTGSIFQFKCTSTSLQFIKFIPHVSSTRAIFSGKFKIYKMAASWKFKRYYTFILKIKSAHNMLMQWRMSSNHTICCNAPAVTVVFTHIRPSLNYF
jgi:hypothetical protein